jgi:hypothetical protein
MRHVGSRTRGSAATSAAPLLVLAEGMSRPNLSQVPADELF